MRELPRGPLVTWLGPNDVWRQGRRVALVDKRFAIIHDEMSGTFWKIHHLRLSPVEPYVEPVEDLGVATCFVCGHQSRRHVGTCNAFGVVTEMYRCEKCGEVEHVNA